MAAVGVVLAGTAVAAGAGPTAAQQVVKPQFAYTCAFPSGAQQVSAQVAVTFPNGGLAGKPIQPTNATITMTIPHPAITDLLKLHAATVTATASLTVTVAENAAAADTTWAGLKVPATVLPANGPLTLTAAGPVPSVTASAPGNVAFTAAALSLLLLPQKADGSAANSSAMPVTCALNSGQAATLATVPVTGATSAPRPGGPIAVTPRADGSTSGTPMRSASSFCPPLPPAGLKLNPRFPPPKPPPHSKRITATPLAGCAYVIGFSDIRKLTGAALIGPGLTNLEVGARVIQNQQANYLQVDNAGQLEYHGLHQFPPATATLLAFGFMPVTATQQLTELGTLNAFAVGPTSPVGCGKCITTTTIYTLVTLRIYNIKVNGVPLNAGSSCQTVSPFVVTVVGKSPAYSIQNGGPLAGTVTIPTFKGCGVGENLDPIFNASISGPGNFVQLTQGSLCTPGPPPFGCPPTVPKPIH
jgi:hypothetical protein